jgi:hypothetical protein
MKRTCLWLAGISSLLVPAYSPLFAEERAVTAQVAEVPTPNAAVIYWSAFGVMPALSQQQREAIREAAYSSEAIPEPVQTDVAYYTSSLRELHRATRVPACDWALDESAGPLMLMPHCQHARDLAAAGVLRARMAFAKGETASAINDILAVLRLARDCGRDPATIAILVDVAVERNANQVLATHLSQLTPAQLDDLRMRLQALPATQNAAAAFRDESDLFAGWVARMIEEEAAKDQDPKAGERILMKIQSEAQIGDSLKGATEEETQRRRDLISSATVDDLRAMVQTMRADYAELARIADLPYLDRAAQFAKFDEGLAKSQQLANRDDLQRVLSIDFLPSYTMVSRRIEESYVRRQLLELAIRALRDGHETIRGASIHGVEVKTVSSDMGLQLTYQLPGAEKPEVLIVPKKK